MSRGPRNYSALGALLGVIVMGTACAGKDANRPLPMAVVVFDPARPWRKPGDKIDSILPMPEYLRRFRVGLREVTRFEGGGSSQTEVARRFLAAVAQGDTSALARLMVSRAEFAWLVFPDHLYAKPPYELDPAIYWLQISAESEKGLTRLLQRYGGERLEFLEVNCLQDTVQVRTGPIQLWSSCGLRYRAGDSVLTRRLFGSLVVRDGRVKLLSLANEF